jgi:hypothetical protein
VDPWLCCFVAGLRPLFSVFWFFGQLCVELQWSQVRVCVGLYVLLGFLPGDVARFTCLSLLINGRVPVYFLKKWFIYLFK